MPTVDISLDSLALDADCKIRLLPELLPKVLRHLDPKKDITSLLTVQRCSTTGWDAATPIIYHTIIVKDWNKFTVCPLLPFIPHFDKLDEKLPSSEYGQTMRRRWRALRFVHDATFDVFPTQLIVEHFQLIINFALLWCVDLDDDARTRSQTFLSLEIIRISAQAWQSLAPWSDATFLAAETVKNPGSIPMPAHITDIAQPLNYCITFPLCKDETALWNHAREMQGFGQPKQLSEYNQLLAMLLASIRDGAYISIHDMIDRWGYLGWTKRSHTYRLFYPKVPQPQFSMIEIIHVRVLTDRMNAYTDMLKKSREFALGQKEEDLEGWPATMQTAFEKLTKRGPPLFGPKPLSTWRITGEGRFAGKLANQRQYTKMMVDNLVTGHHSWGRPEEVLVGEPWLVERSPNEVVGKDDDERDATLKRLVIEAPGNETSCKFCRCT